MDSTQIIYDQCAYRVRVAATCRQRMCGLAGTTRADWPGIDGLVLKMPFPAYWPIWMRGMRMPIRLLWMRRGHVIGEIPCLSPDQQWRCVWPPGAVDAVVELFVGNLE